MTTGLLQWKLRRIAANLRQVDVATRIGTSSSIYSQIERGDRPPSPVEQRLIEDCLPPLPPDSPHRRSDLERESTDCVYRSKAEHPPRAAGRRSGASRFKMQ
jgi:hypothetical protein